MSTVETISIMSVYGAMAAYTVAMIAFAVAMTQPYGKGAKAANIAMSVTTLAFILHLIGTVTRGIAASRVPWANMYEYTLSFTTVAVAVFLWYARGRKPVVVGAVMTPVVLLSLGIAVSVLYVRAQGTPPILDHYWLVIHVSTAILATGLFTFSAILSVLQLIALRKESKVEQRQLATVGGPSSEVPAPGSEKPSWTSQLPSATSLEQNAYKVTVIGFILWTFTLIAGAIWAEHSWGRPWGWDPKETASLIVWFVYSGYLHATTTRGWSGKRAAILCLLGFFAVFANYYLVNLFANSLHSYSGV